MVRVECSDGGPVEGEGVRRRDKGHVRGGIRAGARCDVGIVEDDEAIGINFAGQKVTSRIAGPKRPLLIVTIDVSQDDDILKREDRSERETEVRREIWRRSWRDVDVCDVEVSSGDESFDEDDFRDAVVDGRGDFLEGDGVVDESEQTATPTSAPWTVTPDNREAWKRRETGVCAELRFLDAGNDDVIAGKEVVKLSGRIPNAITVPADDATRRRRIIALAVIFVNNTFSSL